MEFRVLKSYQELEPYIDRVIHFADQNKKSFGFLPRPAYQEQALQGKLWVCIDANGVNCGYLLFGGKPLSPKILQLFVRLESRGNGVGKLLLSELELYGETHNCLSISARVAADLKANQFWERQGYKVCRQVDGGKTTQRRINVRVKNLDVPRLFSLDDFPDETPHIDLVVEASTTLSNTTYAVDINVIFDLVKNRANADIVRQLLGQAMYGNGQICITSEFITELERHTGSFSQDPLLMLATSLPTLPKVSDEVLEPILSQLRCIVFSEKHSVNRLSNNDSSDLRHVALCIHHAISGFVSSDRAVLIASEELYQTFGLRTLSPSDMLNLVSGDDVGQSDGLVFLHNDGDVLIEQFLEEDRQKAECFLSGLGVSEGAMQNILAPGIMGRRRNRWLVKDRNVIIGFSSWGGDELNTYRALHLVIDEHSRFAQNLIDHFIEKATNSISSSGLSLIALYTAIGNDLTRRTAIDRGFRKNTTVNPDIRQYELVKISYDGYITSSTWGGFKSELAKLVSLTLPDRMPTYDEFVYTGAIIHSVSTRGVVKLPLFEIETLFSPATFLCEGREAVIVPIKRAYLEGLVAYSTPQFSLLPSNEALLHVEKAYFKSSKNPNLFKHGDLILFYVSGRTGGQEIVGRGRLTSSRVMDVESVLLKLQRQGALKESELKGIADKNEQVHAITFDNFSFFSNPISYSYLKQNNLISGANLVTAERINAETLRNIINKGESCE